MSPSATSVAVSIFTRILTTLTREDRPVRERHGAPGSRGTIRSQSSDTLENPPGPNRIRRNRLLLGRSAARTVSGAGDLNSSSKARGDLSLHVTSAMVRELRELIRYRYALDHKILSVGKKAKPSQRDSVRDDMRRADAAMVTIRNMLENWDNPEHFSTAEQYQVFLEIKARIANGESRDWLRRPPWAEEQHDADDNIYEKDERSTQPLNNDLPNKRYPRDRLSPEDAQRLLNRHPFAEDLNDQISQRRTVLMNQVHLDQWPEVPDEKLHWTEEDFYPKPVPDAPPGTPESSLDSISKNLGEYSEPQVPAISPEIEVEARNVYSRHVPSSRNDIPHPVFEESEGSESLSDTEEIAFPAVSNNKQPAFVAAILNAIVSDFGLSQMLQDLLQQASTKFPHEELVDLFSNMLQRYHGEVISDSRTAIKPQVKEVLGIGRFRDIVARRVLDKHILARLDSDDETSDKATDRLTLSSKLNSFSNISSESWAFRNLLNSIKELLLPSDLLDDLLPIPRCHITYETSRDPTAFETLQWRFEELTDLEWDWWPLPPSKRRLYSGESRVLWRCVSELLQTQRTRELTGAKSCGMTRWRELPIEQQGLLREVLVHRPVESGTVSSCMVTQQPAKRFSIPFRMVLGSGSSIGRNPGQARSTTSSARSRYTPAGNRSNIGSCAQGGSAANNAGSVSQTATTPGNPTASNVPLCTNKQLWIIFGVEGPLEPLELSQINNDYLHNDQIFIRELRQRHWKLRGWPRILFSIWRLRYWEFVKVSMS